MKFSECENLRVAKDDKDLPPGGIEFNEKVFMLGKFCVEIVVSEYENSFFDLGIGAHGCTKGKSCCE
jgi:hypothetical protein